MKSAGAISAVTAVATATSSLAFVPGVATTAPGIVDSTVRRRAGGARARAR